MTSVYEHFNISVPTDVIEILHRVRFADGTDTPRLLELAQALASELTVKGGWEERQTRLFVAKFIVASEWGSAAAATEANFFILDALSNLDLKTATDN